MLVFFCLLLDCPIFDVFYLLFSTFLFSNECKHSIGLGFSENVHSAEINLSEVMASLFNDFFSDSLQSTILDLFFFMNFLCQYFRNTQKLFIFI